MQNCKSKWLEEFVGLEEMEENLIHGKLSPRLTIGNWLGFEAEGLWKNWALVHLYVFEECNDYSVPKIEIFSFLLPSVGPKSIRLLELASAARVPRK